MSADSHEHDERDQHDERAHDERAQNERAHDERDQHDESRRGGWQHGQAVQLLLGLTAYCATYLGLQLSKSPLLYYLPEQRSFTLSPTTTPHAMGYYGLLLGSLVGFAFGYALGWLPLVRRIFSRRFYGRALATMATVAVFGSMAAVLVVELLA